MPGADLPAALQPDAALLFETVREAGALGLRLSRQGVRHWKKPDGSTVTEADLEIDALLKARINAVRPEDGWLSEETPDDPARLARQRLWVADPIDGTNSFVNGTDGWCIGMALVAGQRPVLAALYRPALGEFFWAAQGCGAFCNDTRLTARDATGLQGAELLGTNRASRILEPCGVKGQHAPHIPLLLRLAFVAAGRADIALSFGNKNDWDLAAGDLLAEEAGAKVTGLDGRPYTYNNPQPWQNGLLAAGRERHAAVLAQLEKL
ncbi:MAG: 3'(2'),5'-bisphosphate nucleotidase CysQ [Alphaproteobacteria bacterium]|nr:3'(2'),5'-bisphosphate nucleotidase CysQ [Alphaproteobacteria bacterium]